MFFVVVVVVVFVFFLLFVPLQENEEVLSLQEDSRDNRKNLVSISITILRLIFTFIFMFTSDIMASPSVIISHIIPQITVMQMCNPQCCL